MLPNNQTHRIRHRVTCQTPLEIVYLMKCTCNYFYVGKTKHPFFKQIKDHVSLIKKGKMETPISHHVDLFHGFSLITIKFMALEHIPTDVRGGSNNQRLLQLESH